MQGGCFRLLGSNLKYSDIKTGAFTGILIGVGVITCGVYNFIKGLGKTLLTQLQFTK